MPAGLGKEVKTSHTQASFFFLQNKILSFSKNNNMARRSKPRSHTKWGVVVCGVGQAFWHLKLAKSQKVGRLCHCCCYFLIKNCRSGIQDDNSISVRSTVF